MLARIIPSLPLPAHLAKKQPASPPPSHPKFKAAHHLAVAIPVLAAALITAPVVFPTGLLFGTCVSLFGQQAGSHNPKWPAYVTFATTAAISYGADHLEAARKMLNDDKSVSTL